MLDLVTNSQVPQSSCEFGQIFCSNMSLKYLDQMLDLVTMEPKLAGELTAAEKYIIKSRLRYVSIRIIIKVFIFTIVVIMMPWCQPGLSFGKLKRLQVLFAPPTGLC